MMKIICHHLTGRNEKGQATLEYLLVLAVVGLGVAAALYSPEIRQSIPDLYADAATRVLESGSTAGNAATSGGTVQPAGGSTPAPSPPISSPAPSQNNPVSQPPSNAPTAQNQKPVSSPSGSSGSSQKPVNSGQTGNSQTTIQSGSQTTGATSPTGKPQVPEPPGTLSDGQNASSSNPLESSFLNGNENGVCQAEANQNSFL